MDYRDRYDVDGIVEDFDKWDVIQEYEWQVGCFR